MSNITELATGLQFPEGPVVMPDGSIVVTEIKSGTLARVQPDGSGTVERFANLGGGPNGAALGPDGYLYIANNGGFLWSELNGALLPVDLETRSNMHAFVHDYEAARGAPFTAAQRELLDAANLALTSYGARCQHSLLVSDPEVSGSEDEWWLGALRTRPDRVLA